MWPWYRLWTARTAACLSGALYVLLIVPGFEVAPVAIPGVVPVVKTGAKAMDLFERRGRGTDDGTRESSTSSGGSSSGGSSSGSSGSSTQSGGESAGEDRKKPRKPAPDSSIGR